jgi:hypothetical protein
MSWNIVEMVKVLCRECGADFLMREDDNYIFCMSCEDAIANGFPDFDDEV